MLFPTGLSSSFSLPNPLTIRPSLSPGSFLLRNPTYGQGVFRSNNLIASREEEVEVAGVSVFPNPVSDWINIESQANQPLGTVKLISSGGVVAVEQHFGQNRRGRINTQALADGWYYVCVNQGPERTGSSFSGGGRSASSVISGQPTSSSPSSGSVPLQKGIPVLILH